MRPRIVSTLLLSLGVFATTVRAQETVLTLDPTQTMVEFTLGDVLHTVHGSFKLSRGTIYYNPSTGKASGSVVVDARSGNSGSGARDRKMHKNILESDKYPEIVFTPDRVEGKLDQRHASQVQVHGLFTIHGTPHEVTLPVQVQMDGEKLTAATKLPVPYVEWGMKNPSTFMLRVNDTVTIEIHAVGRIGPVH
jgi:polyisoprenoid-binding protein YceI